MTIDPAPSTPATRVLAMLGANVIGRVLNIAIQVASAAIFIRLWGVELYGEWLLLTAVPVYLASADLGFSAAAANEITMLASRGQRDQAERVFRNCFGLVIAVGLAIVVIALAILTLHPPHVLAAGSRITPGQSKLVLVMLTLSVLLGLPNELFIGGFRMGGRQALGAMNNNAFSLIEFVLTAAAVFVVRSPVGVAGAILAARTLRVVGTGIMLKTLMQWPASFRPSFHWGEMWRLAGPALGFTSFPISRALGNQGMVLVIGYVISPAAVVVFTSARTLCRFVSTVAELFANSIYSEVSTAFGQGRLEVLRRLQRLGSQAAFWTGAGVGVFLVFAKGPIAQVWLHGKIAFPLEVIAPLVLAEGAAAIYRINLVVLSAANRHTHSAMVYLVSSALSVGIGYLLLERLGVAGAAVAVAFAELSMLAFTAFPAGQMLEMPASAVLLHAASPPIELLRLSLQVTRRIAQRLMPAHNG